MNNRLDGLSLPEEWKARSNLGSESLFDAGFINRLAKAGEQNNAAADDAAKAADYDAYWDWISDLSKRASLLGGERSLNVFHRFFCLRFSLDAPGDAQGAALSFEDTLEAAKPPTDLAYLARALLDFLDNAAARGTLSLSALELLVSRMGPLEPLPSGAPEARKLKAFAADFFQELVEGKEHIAPLTLAQSILGLLLVESLFRGRAAALDAMMKRFKYLSNKPMILMKIGYLLFFYGAYEKFRESEWRSFLAPGKLDTEEIEAASFLLFMTMESPPSWSKKLFYDWLSPSIRHALDSGDFRRAQTLLKIITYYGLSPHREEHEKSVLDHYFPYLEKAASAFGAVSGEIPITDLRGGDERRIAFVSTVRLGWGAPMRIALFFIQVLNKHFPGRFQISLYSPYGDPDEGLIDAFQKQGAAVRWIDGPGGAESSGVDPQVLKAVQLRTEFAAQKIEVAMFFRGDVILESLFSHVRVAPVQIFWSFGYDWPSFRNMDGLLSCVPDASPIKQRGGRPWHWYRLIFSPLGDMDEKKVTDMREKVAGGSFTFGTLCQSFKVDSPEFISSLTEILNRVPNAIYIWSGTYMPQNVVTMMKEHGIHERCVFVGWVNSNLYQRLIDVFLDTFPFGNGLSAAEAMSIGKPVISMTEEQNLKGYIFEPAKKGWFGEEEKKKFAEAVKDGGYFSFTNTKDYIETAVRLAADKNFYNKAGETSSKLANEFLFNTESSARIFANAVDDIVKRTAKKP